MGVYVTLVVSFLIVVQMQWDYVVSIRKRPGVGRTLNSRTRFQQRINRLGHSKIDLIRSGRLGKNRGLPPGFSLIGGQVVDSTNKIIQRMVPGGTSYLSYQGVQTQRPLYMRAGAEHGWNFVVFQDPFYWRGSGHLILFKKLLGVNINKSPFQRDTLYEAYVISLRVSMHPQVNIRDPIFRRKLRKRQRKYKKIMAVKQKYRQGSSFHLKDRKGKFGKRKKRNVLTVRHTTLLNRGDCLLKPLNVTQFLSRVQKVLNNNNTLRHKNGSKKFQSHALINNTIQNIV